MSSTIYSFFKHIVMQKSYISTGKKLLSFILIVVMVSSCKKDQKDECTATVASVAGTYKLTALKYKAGASAPDQDYLLMRDDCENDDLIILNANGTYQYQDAGISCSPDGNDNGTWGITGNMVFSDGIVGGTIESFDCRSLTVYTSNFMVPGDKITMTITRQ